MDGEIEVASSVLAQLFFSRQAILFFCPSIFPPRVLRGSLLVEKKAVQNSRWHPVPFQYTHDPKLICFNFFFFCNPCIRSSSSTTVSA